MSETFANDISSSNICAKKFSNSKEIKVCEDIINNIDTNDYIDTSPPPDGRASPQGEA
jgi:hypothetical protein